MGPPAEAAGHSSLLRRGLYLVRQKDFDQVARLGAVDQTQRALGSEAAHRLTRGLARNANVAGEPKNRKAELALACKAAMPHEMGIDHALD